MTLAGTNIPGRASFKNEVPKRAISTRLCFWHLLCIYMGRILTQTIERDIGEFSMYLKNINL